MLEFEKITVLLSDCRCLHDLTSLVSQAARRIVGADGATFVLRKGDMVHYVDEDAFAPLWKGKIFPASACVSGHALLNHTDVIVPDIAEDPRIPTELYRPTFVKSLAITPIGNGAARGAIGAYWKKYHQATTSEMAKLHRLAEMADSVLERLPDH